MLTQSDCQCGHAHGEKPELDDTEAEGNDQPAPSLAYQLWHPWRLIVMNPLPVLIAYILSNTVFVTVGGILRFLAHYLTIPGLVVTLFLAIILAIRRIASLLTYPGQLELVIREGEASFARLTQRRLQIFTEAALELTKVLDTRLSTEPMRLRFLQVHQNFTFALETMLMPLMQSLEILERDGHLGTRGKKLLTITREVVKLNAEHLSGPCSRLCAASDKTFETQRQAMFLKEKDTEVEAVGPSSRTKLFAALKPGLKRSTTVDTAALETKAATKDSPDETLHPLLVFTVAVRRLQTAIPSIGRPKTDAPTTRSVSWIVKELCRGTDSNVDYIATLDLLRADMTVRFKAEHLWIPGYQNHQVDAMLMPPASNATDRPVVILCNPNGGLYEFHHLQMDWIKFYTEEVDCHVLVYNYRGYGRCKGSPSPALHNLDGLAIVEFLKNERGMKRIAVHGESIGGLVATYVGCMSPHVSAIIADRTFATVPALAQRMIARWAGTVVDWVMRWETDNVRNYLDATCAKLLCSDPCDEIIVDGASLKSGVALRLELGDTTFEVLRQRQATDDTLASPRSIKSCFGLPRSSSRVSEAASHPLLGHPLTEIMVARFCQAVISLGKRALEYSMHHDKKEASHEEAKGSDQKAEAVTSVNHVTIAVNEAPTAINEDEMCVANEKHPMLLSDATSAPTFPPELLPVVWIELARVDGYCGQVLLQAVETGGMDHLRAWIASLLTWGGRLLPTRRTRRSVEPFARDGMVIVPIMVDELHTTLQHLVKEHPPLKLDYDIGFLILMIEYLHDTLQRRWDEVDKCRGEAVQNDETSAAREEKKNVASVRIDTGDPKLGSLLPLHCGHNKNYDDAEKQALIGFLRNAGFGDPTMN